MARPRCVVVPERHTGLPYLRSLRQPAGLRRRLYSLLTLNTYLNGVHILRKRHLLPYWQLLATLMASILIGNYWQQ